MATARRPRSGSGLAVLIGLVGLLLLAGPAASAVAVPTPASAAVPSATARAAAAAFGLGEDGLAPAAISLNWTASTAAGFDNYSVFYARSGPTGPWTYVTNVGAESTATVVVDNLGPGSTYWWNVTEYTTTGGLLGIGARTTETYSSILETTQPTTAYLTARALGSTAVQLNWTNNASYGGGIARGYYQVEEVAGGTTSLAANLTDRPGVNGTTVSGLDASANYAFYVVTVDDCSGCTPGGTSATQSNVVVFGTPAPLVASVSASLSTVDTGLPDSFACTPAGGAPPYQFAWNFTSGSSYRAGPGTTSWAYAAAGTYHVDCNVSDPSSFVITAPITVVVNPAPTLDASVSTLNATVGSALTFRCTAAGGTRPLAVRWDLGNGGSIVGASGGSSANGSASYGSTGTYTAQCIVTDAVGARVSTSVLIDVRGRPAFWWVTPSLLLGSALAAGVILAVGVGLSRRRDEESQRSSAMSRWLPPVGPAQSVHGSKICPKCGASNVPLRRSCQACGAPLPRNPGG